MKDGRMSVYFGPQDRKVMEEAIAEIVQPAGDIRSEAEFLRYCVLYTLEHDKSLKKTETERKINAK